MAAHATATRIIEHHGQHLSETDQGEMYLIKQGVHALLQYKLSLLEICKLRVQSLESRSQNMINLAFNTVNQQNSQIMKADSQSMKVIAIVTMLFLPAATVATICGSQFFNFDEESQKVVISVDFKFFWATTVPLTILVFFSYVLKQQLKGPKPPILSWGSKAPFDSKKVVFG
ncbi:MAG: hypothetical protein L6R41_007292 [Letrouitia leprolyta]|nr:MAG: hypothetical protein L6R41_007292 [Letrouitia leprolyta]